MKFAMAVGAGGDGVFNAIRPAFGQGAHMVHLKERLASGGFERCGSVANFTHAAGCQQNPRDNIRISDKPIRGLRSFRMPLRAGRRWREFAASRAHLFLGSGNPVRKFGWVGSWLFGLISGALTDRLVISPEENRFSAFLEVGLVPGIQPLTKPGWMMVFGIGPELACPRIGG